MSAVLVIDVGNTSTSIGLFRAGRVTRVRRMPTAGSSTAGCERAARSVAGRTTLQGAVVASVVPRAEHAWSQALDRLAVGAVHWVNHRTRLGVKVGYARPETIGADRLANACGGADRYGVPLIVADFGTAVTFDVVLARRGYAGGIIAPGLPLMFDYLAEKTALLPHIGPGRTRHRIGRSTSEAMQLGARWGYRGMVREIVLNLLQQPALRKAKLVATGGYAGWVVRGLRPRMVLDHDLTLRGLGKIFELNVEGTS